jgi:hypothetical protein
MSTITITGTDITDGMTIAGGTGLITDVVKTADTVAFTIYSIPMGRDAAAVSGPIGDVSLNIDVAA